jgi:hypothetical protein
MLRSIINDWEVKLASRDNNRRVRPFEWGVDDLGPELTALLDVSGAGGGLAGRPCFAEDLRLATVDEGAGRTIFEFNERGIAASDSLFRARPVSDYSYDGRWVSFASPLQSPYPENNTVHARYFPVTRPSRNGRLNGSGSDQVSRARGRAVLVLPQWNADVEGHVGVCRLLNRVGIAALRLSLPYHDRRMLAGFERADFLVSANIGRTLHAMIQAVVDSRAAIDWLVQQGYDRIGIVGTSVGSCIAFLAVVHDQRLRASVHLHVSSYFGDVVWEGLTTRHVRQGLETALTREEVRRAWLLISPNSFVQRLAGDGRARLMISGAYDPTFTPALSQLLFEECRQWGVRFDKRLVPCGHYTMGEAPFKYFAGYLIAKYLSRHL